MLKRGKRRKRKSKVLPAGEKETCARDSVVVWGGASLKLSSQDRSPRSGAGCSGVEEQLYS